MTNRGTAASRGRRKRPGRTGKAPHTKLAITLPAEQAEAIREAVAGGAAPSVSAFLSQAAAEKLEQDSLADLIAEMKRELGEPEPDVYAEVEAALAQQRRAREGGK
jgi:Arc/MetJ-type ribon-helix-helix transcriptional regulator